MSEESEFFDVFERLDRNRVDMIQLNEVLNTKTRSEFLKLKLHSLKYPSSSSG